MKSSIGVSVCNDITNMFGGSNIKYAKYAILGCVSCFVLSHIKECMFFGSVANARRNDMTRIEQSGLTVHILAG